MHSVAIVPTQNIKIRKGLYVNQACTHCRANHRRCNGEAPCSRCAKFKLDCVYEKPKPRGGFRIKIQKQSHEQQLYTAYQDSCTSLNNAMTVVNNNTNVIMMINFFTTAFYQTVDFRLCPVLLPNHSLALDPDQKFRVLSSVGYAALAVGHIEQGHLFMDQAKQYLPQAMSSTTMDAAFGFHHLGLSHLLEQDYTVGVNYLKVSKSLASSIYNMQRSQGRMDLLVTGVHETKPIPQSVALKLRYYLNAITVCDTKDEVRRRLNGLATITEKWSQVQIHIYNLTKSIINLPYCATREELLGVIDLIEESARNFGPSIEFISQGYIHIARSIRFAFFRDYLALNEECDQFMRLFKTLQVHDLSTTKMVTFAEYHWSTFGVPRIRIQELETYARQLSVNCPGYRIFCKQYVSEVQDPLAVLVERLSKSSEESVTDTDVVDPFTNADVLVPALDENFIFDELLEVTPY